MTDSKYRLPYDKGFMSGRLRVEKCTILYNILQCVMHSNVKNQCRTYWIIIFHIQNLLGYNIILFFYSNYNTIIRIKTTESASLYGKEICVNLFDCPKINFWIWKRKSLIVHPQNLLNSSKKSFDVISIYHLELLCHCLSVAWEKSKTICFIVISSLVKGIGFEWVKILRKYWEIVTIIKIKTKFLKG